MSGAGVDKDQPKTSGGTPMYTELPQAMRRLCSCFSTLAPTQFFSPWMVRQTVVQLLCNAGSNTDPHIIDGATPIFIAAEKGNKAVARLLCEAGANKIRS